ncbi:MAG: portal protein [Alphaproteobacteria bacterium]
MPDSTAKEIIRRQETLKSERGLFESHWQEIADLIRPMRSDFVTLRTPGEKRMQKIFDGTPGLALQNLASGLWGMITNSANEWFALQSPDDELNRRRDVKLWLDEAGKRMRDTFAAQGQRFYAKVLELYQDLAAFGTGVFYAEDDLAKGEVFFSCRHLAECFIAEDERERVDTLYRRFRFTARQAVQKWPGQVSEKIQVASEKEPDRAFDFIHAVYPNDDFNPRRMDARGKKWKSVYVEVEGAKVLAQGGYADFPFMVPRWSTASRALYGDSPAMLALPDAKMLNAMAKTTIVAAQKVADPPLLAPDEMAARGVRTSPGGMIYGGIDSQGRRMYEPLVTNARIDIGLEMENQRRDAVREAFFFSLLLMVQQPNATATEVLARQEEKLRLMGPHLGRIQSEFLDPLIDRVFAIMLRAGRFPDPPQALIENPDLKVVYVSPLARAQKASEGQSIMRTMEAVAPLAAADPAVWENFDIDETARAVAEAFGTPAKLLRDPEDVQARRQQKQAAAAMANMAAMAKPAAGALKDVVTANEAMRAGLMKQNAPQAPGTAQGTPS